MKAFITHAFGSDDERLANALKADLEAAGIEGYMAEKTQRYDLLISDKIRQEIDGSDWLVAVITRRSQASPSVHEEIGYALGKEVKVALMVEEGVEKSGVLVYGREYEVFRPTEFGMHTRRIVESIRVSPPAARSLPRMGEAARALLEGRNTLSADAANFAQNAHFASLHTGGFYNEGETPVILFTACPHDLRDYGSVTAPDFIEWAESGPPVTVEGHEIILGGPDLKIDIKTLHLFKKSRQGFPGKDVSSYLEFQNNGFLEYGTSSLFHGWDHGTDSLRLCHTMGIFWGFLACTRLFYQRLGADSPYTVALSVRNISKLTLGNYGDEAVLDSNWRYKRQLSFAPGEPATDHTNIRLPHVFEPAGRVSDAAIAGAVREVAEMLCNAYGESHPKCYDDNGKFAWKLWERVSS